MLASAVANHIRPVLLRILPWTAGTNAQLQLRDNRNLALDSLATVYGCVCVNAESLVGQNRVGGDAGNLWDIKTAYNNANVHFVNGGFTQIATAIKNALFP
jgi:hypothetical protein